MKEDCLFCKIIKGEIPSEKIYEDEKILVFRDIHPAAPVHILIVPKNNIVDKKNYSKCILIFYGIASLLIIITSLFTIGVLGEHLASFYQYPEYILLKRISIFGFIDRIENLLSISWIFSTFATLSLIIYYISNNLNKKEKKKIPSIIISIIIIVCSLYIFKNNTFFNNYVSNIYPYILSIFFIIFVFIT